MDPIRFAGTIRYRDPAKASGLAVVDIPAEHIPALGGLKQPASVSQYAHQAFTIAR